MAGIQRLEILRDGAAAIYGADAVAGVVNTVTRTNIHGGSLDFRYGEAEGTHRREFQVTGTAGTQLRRRTRQRLAVPRLYPPHPRSSPRTSPIRRRTTHVLFRRRSRLSPATSPPTGAATQIALGEHRRSSTGPARSAAAPATRRSLRRPAPSTPSRPPIPSCSVTLSADTCLGSGTARRHRRCARSVSTRVPARRSRRASTATTASPARITTSRTASRSMARRASIMPRRAASSPPTINLNAIVSPASNYWNPFGPTTINGQPNPNRISGLTNVPAGRPGGAPFHPSLRRCRQAGSERHQLAVALPGRR